MDTLRLAAEKALFLPADRVSDDTSVLTLKNLVLEPLCRWSNGRVRPGLFAEWSHHDGGRRWRFRLRDGARFHDGKPCTAEDVLAHVDGLLASVDMFGMKWSYARYLAETRFTILAPQLIEAACPHPFADLLDIFAEFYLCRPTQAGRPILGTGPYRVTDEDEGRRVVLARVRDGAGPSRIVVTAIADAADRHRALRAGEVDAALNLERSARPLDFDPRFAWGRAVNTLSVIYYLNCFAGPFTQESARRAVNLAVDRRRIIEQLFHGLAVPASTIVSPLHLGAAAATLPPIAHDPAAAKALFDAARLEGEIVIRTPEFLPEKARQISLAVQEDLRAVGVAARLDVQADRPEYAREVGRKHIGDMAIFDSSPHSTYRILNDKISSATKAVWWQGYHDDEVERLIVAANRAVDDDARERAYARCLERLNANPPWLYLFHPIDVFASVRELRSVTLDSRGVLVVAT